MSKKHFSKFITFAALSGVVAAGVSYFLKYKSFHQELEEDFHEFEPASTHDESAASDRSYVTIHTDKISDDLQTLKKEATETLQEIGHAVAKGKDTASEIYTDIKDAAADSWHKAERSVSHAAAGVKDASSNFVEAATDTIAEKMDKQDTKEDHSTTIIEEDTQN